MRDLYRQLKENETILWEGRPNKRAYLLSCTLSDPVIFGTLWGILVAILTVMFVSQLDVVDTLFAVTVVAFLTVLEAPLWIGIYNIISIRTKYESIYYVITDKRILTRAGVVPTRISSISYRDILNTSINVGVIDKYCGIGSISISVAGYYDEANTLSHIDNAASVVKIIQEGVDCEVNNKVR